MNQVATSIGGDRNHAAVKSNTIVSLCERRRLLSMCILYELPLPHSIQQGAANRYSLFARGSCSQDRDTTEDNDGPAIRDMSKLQELGAKQLFGQSPES